jgi:hypothetical protein
VTTDDEQGGLRCAACGSEGPDVQLHEPLPPDEGEPAPLCSDCWKEYLLARALERASHQSRP